MDVREKMIELLADCERECHTIPCSECDYFGKPCCSSQWKADRLIANGATVQEWIPVTERLPENKSCILMYSADGGVAEGIYDKDQKRWIQFRWSVLNVPSVTHWMPLPMPPKGE